MIIETENLIIKPYNENDFRNFSTIHTDKNVMKYFNGGVMNIKQAKERWIDVQLHQLKYGFSYYAVYNKYTNEYIGQTGLNYTSTMSLNLCYALYTKYQNKGYGTEMVIAILKQGFEELKFSIISVLIAVKNIPSIHLVEKLGGKRGEEVILQDNLIAVNYSIEKDNFYSAIKKLKKYEYREAIGAMLINDNGLIYSFQRIDFPDTWQCVEGGIENNDSPINTSYKEIEEEIGIKKNQLQYITETKYFFKYNFKDNKINKYGQIGQKKKFFLFKLIDKDAHFNFKSTPEEQEFTNYKLLKSNELLKLVCDFKIDLYKYVISEFKTYLK